MEKNTEQHEVPAKIKAETKLVMIVVAIVILIYLLYNFPKITLLISLPAVILALYRDSIITRKKNEEKIEKIKTIAYVEYCESMKGKDAIKSYEEFVQEGINLTRKKMNEALKIRNAKEAVKIRAQETAKLKSTIHIPKCPTCGSPSIEKIPAAVKIFFLGPFAPLYKTYKCNHCGCKW